MAGQDGPHNYVNGITLSKITDPHSSSDGPAPAGPMHMEQTASPVPSASDFSSAHSAARGGDFNEWGSYTAPTAPGHLGSSPMFPSTTNPQSYEPGMPTLVSRVDGRNENPAYAWPDAPGGGLGNHKE